MFNACFSLSQAKAVTEAAYCLIGTSDAVGDLESVTFASSFYRAIVIGRSGEAFEEGRTTLLFDNASDNTPSPLTRPGVDASRIVLIDQCRAFDPRWTSAAVTCR